MTNPVVREYSSFISRFLSNGAPDGTELLNHAQGNNLLEILYLATRQSSYAESWRRLAGQVEIDEVKGIRKSILGLAVAVIAKYVGTAGGDLLQDSASVQEDISFCLRIIANCCADNNANRKEVAVSCGGFRWLMDLLELPVDADVLVQTLYNLCVEYDEPASTWHNSPLSQTQDSIPVTKTEELLATCGRAGSVYVGGVKLLNARLIARCSSDGLECLTELIEMACRPIAIEASTTDELDLSADLIRRLLALDGGMVLAQSSLTGRVNICRALLEVSTRDQIKTHLAATGDIFSFVMVAETQAVAIESAMEEDDDDENEQEEALRNVQTANIKLLYQVCQLPEFADPPKYGIARQSMIELFDSELNSSQYRKAVALISLYGFVNSDVRASLLTCEGLIPVLVRMLFQETDKTILYPAVGLVSKVAVTWRLRRELVEAGTIQAVRHLLVDPGLGLEIPIHTIILLELLIKGQPEHLDYLTSSFGGQNDSGSILDDIAVLFDRGHEAINFEIGRLMIEIGSTAGLRTHEATESEKASLEILLENTNDDFWIKVLVFMSTKAQTMDAQSSNRVWFAMGLLSTNPRGQQILTNVLQHSDVQNNMQLLLEDKNSPVAQNIKFMMHNCSIHGATSLDNDLSTALEKVQLG